MISSQFILNLGNVGKHALRRRIVYRALLSAFFTRSARLFHR